MLFRSPVLSAVVVALALVAHASAQCVPPSITSQPSSRNVCLGSPTTFSVAAQGTAPFSYQWRKDGLSIAGATSASFAIAQVMAADAGSYDVSVKNACGDVFTSPATLTVDTAPSITTHPTGLTVCEGSPASFSVVATGTAPLAYQWRKNGTDIPGAMSATYAIAQAAVADGGSYDVVVTNTCGFTTSNAATLTVDTAPSITTHPTGLTVCAGSPASFSVVATGTAPLAYQWRKNGTDIPGATSATYAIAQAAGADAGDYDVVVTNACGSAPSNVAPLAVNDVPAITTQPMSRAVCVGTMVSFSVVATGLSNSYQWHKNLVPIAGATSATFVIASAQVIDAGTYTVTVTNPCGQVTSAGAVLAVDANPRITSFCLAAGSQPRRVLAVDLDGVNGEDMVVAAYGSGTLEVALNDSASQLVPHPPTPLAQGVSGLAAADFDGDGRADVAVTNRLAGNVSVLYGDGSGAFATTFVLTTGGDPVAVVAAAVLGHARADLVIADASGNVLVATNDANTTPGARTFSPATVLASGGSFTDVAIGDVVGSAAAEILATEAAAGVVHAFDAATLNAVAGSPWPCGPGPAALAVLDVTGDGKADPIVGGSGGVTVVETPNMAGNRVWMGQTVSVTAGNLTGDGKADLALVEASGQVLVLHGYNNGAPPDGIEAGSCLLTGTHITTGRISRIGRVGSEMLNTDELLLVRSSLGLACVLRSRLESQLLPIAGTGCTGFTDMGSAIGQPIVGNAAFILTLTGARASSFTAMLMQLQSPSGTPPPIFSFGPCRHTFDQAQPYFSGFVLTSTTGQAFYPFPIPNWTAFVGLELRWQWLTVDPNGPVLGGTFSSAALLRVGEF